MCHAGIDLMSPYNKYQPKTKGLVIECSGDKQVKVAYYNREGLGYILFRDFVVSASMSMSQC